jgi:hypothetical protein
MIPYSFQCIFIVMWLLDDELVMQCKVPVGGYDSMTLPMRYSNAFLTSEQHAMHPQFSLSYAQYRPDKLCSV